MRLIVVRHGQTEENVSNTIQGQEHGTLTEKGKEQVKKLAKRLSNVNIDHIYSSDLRRADKTAKEITRYHSISIESRKELRERDLGEMEGELWETFDQDREKKGGSKLKYRPQGGESYMDMFERVKPFFNELLEKHQAETVVAVAHGILNSVLIGTILEMKPKIAREIKQKNTCLNIFEIDGEKVKTINLNDIRHLEE